MVRRRTMTALAAVALWAAAGVASADAQSHGQYSTPAPTTTVPPGSTSGALGTVAGAGEARPVDSTSVSLDAVAANPARYDGKTLGRRVTLGATKPSGGAVAVAARDAATGAKIGTDSTGFTLVMTKEPASGLDGHQADAILTFTVTKLPIPGGDVWMGIISRIELLDANGAVTKTISAN